MKEEKGHSFPPTPYHTLPHHSPMSSSLLSLPLGLFFLLPCPLQPVLSAGGQGQGGHRGQEPIAEDMEQSVVRDMEERERKLSINMARMEEQHGAMLEDLHTEINKMKKMNKGETLVSLI